MTLTNAIPTITQLSAQVLACPCVIAKPITADEVWYPNISLKMATLPAILLVETSQERVRYAEGAIPLISGTFKIIFYEAGTDPGLVEAFARQLVLELGSQYYGLCFRNFQVGRCSDPTPGQRAVADGKPSADYRSIAITVQYGLSR